MPGVDGVGQDFADIDNDRLCNKTSLCAEGGAMDCLHLEFGRMAVGLSTVYLQLSV